MAPKRKVLEAFGQSAGQLSAFAAARQVKRFDQIAGQPGAVTAVESVNPLASTIAEEPYDGNHYSASTIQRDDQVSPGQSPSIYPDAVDVQFSTDSLAGLHVLRDDAKCLQLRLQNDDIVTPVGEYDIKVLDGVISIYGAVLRPDTPVQRVCAPTSHALPSITARKDDAILQISSVKHGLKGLARLSPLFRNIWSQAKTNDRSFALLPNSRNDDVQRYPSTLEIDESYKKVISKLGSRLQTDDRAPQILAAGAKSSGKSTFNRIVCNMIVSRPGAQKCAYLDLDPGQPEFGPPGVLSLVEINTLILGPPFSHPATSQSKKIRLIRSHELAAVTFRDDPEHYLACAADLIRHAPQDVPLVVNSCGWVAGLGASVLVELASKLSNVEIVILDIGDNSLVDSLSAIARDVHRIVRQPVRSAIRAPAEQRAMLTMAYFHHKHDAGNDSSRWMERSISTMRPWVVSYSGSDPGISAVLSYGQPPHQEFLAEVLDGSVVAMVVSNSTMVPPDLIQLTPKESLPYLPPNSEGFVTPLDPRYSECIGLALVRGIDAESKTLILSTPLTAGQIAGIAQRQVILVQGNFDCPEWAYLEDLHASGNSTGLDEDVPWVSRKDAMIGIEAAVWRLRHPPVR